ncbi:hypothetical protein F4775DRAFT_564416 [Biscogniauxia sp. FL1348]|nr:hypothetical protein F4775DRAFT_564416 [Biscogniauxia sp. FL1348]
MAYNNSATGGATQCNLGIQINRMKHYNISLISRTVTEGCNSNSRTRFFVYAPQTPVQETCKTHVISRRHSSEFAQEKGRGKVTKMVERVEKEMTTGALKEHGPCTNIQRASSILNGLTMANMIAPRGWVEKYTSVIHSRHREPKQLNNVRTRIQKIGKKEAPRAGKNTLPFAPQFPHGEDDLMRSMATILSARGSSQKILYTRSTKLLAVALLLSEWGWDIEILVENDDMEVVPIRAGSSAMCVVYTPAPTHGEGRHKSRPELLQ